MADPVRWGLLSTAHINEKLLAGAAEASGVEVVAVASRDAARCAGYALEHGIPRSHGSYEALLADPEVDAIYISLPNGMHVPWSLRAIEAGKHVLCEKPLTRRAAEAEQAFDAAEAAGVVLEEAFMYRHHPQARRLRRLVDEGVIGEPRLVRGAFSYAMRDPEVNVRMDPALEGGALMDIGCYPVSGARLVLGEPVEVQAVQLAEPGGVDVRFTALLRFAGDAVALVDCAFDMPFRDELEVVGSEGSLFLDDPWHSVQTVIERRVDGRVEQIVVEPVNPYACELEHVSAAVRGEDAFLLGRADAVAQARTLEALYEAAAEGRAVSL